MCNVARILTVDADPEGAGGTARLLEDADDAFEVRSVRSEMDGLGALEAGLDCVVVDHRPPDIDGLGFLERVRETHPDLPVILLVEDRSAEVVSDAVAAGVTDCLRPGPEPARRQLLVNRIEDAVSRYRHTHSAATLTGRDRRSFDRLLGMYVISRTVDGEPIVEDCNERFATYLGYDREALLGTSLAALRLEEATEASHDDERLAIADTDRIDDFDPAAEPEVESREWILETADGDRVPVRVRSAPSPDGEDSALTVLAFDDTSDRKRLEAELRWYDELVNTVPDAIYALDEDMHYLFVNEGMANLTGYPRSEIIGAHKSKVNTDESVESGRLKREDLKQRGLDGMEVGFHPHVTADGEEIPTEVRFRALPTADEAFRGTAGVIRDITERLERERTLERQNRRLDEFASIVSHDLRNPLNIAGGQLELLRDACECGAVEEPLAVTIEELGRMNEIIEDVLSFARHGTQVTEYAVVSLESVAQSAWKAVESNDARLRLETDDQLLAERLRLQRFFENVFRNAVEHAGCDVTVRVGSLPDGFYVEDDGPGIPEADRETVFDVGVTTAVDGTGFGLAIVKTIAETHGWSIELTEGRDGGARFEISGVDTNPEPPDADD